MGNTYANTVVVGTTQEAVVDALGGRAAFVTRLGRGSADALAAALAADGLATDAHVAALAALGLDPLAAGWGYGYMAQAPADERPPGLIATA